MPATRLRSLAWETAAIWPPSSVTIITRDGQRWISFKDFQDRELLQISLVRKKEFPWEQ